MLKRLGVALAVCGLLAVVQGANAADAEKMSGKIEKVEKDHIVLKVKEESRKVKVESTTEMTLDGKKVALTDLKKGFTAEVTAEKDGTDWKATKIAAKKVTEPALSTVKQPRAFPDDEDEKAEEFAGTVKQVEKTTLKITDDNKKEHSIDVGSDAAITLDGKKATLAELKEGFTVKVSAVKKEGKLTAKKITATSKA